MKNSRINKRNVRYVRSPLYISFHLLSLSLLVLSLSMCVQPLPSHTFFSLFFPFFFFASLFSTDKQCIVEMKIGCTAALRESLINFLIIRWSNFAIYAASRVKTTRGKNGKREGEGRGSILSGLLMLSVCYFRKILFVESCTCSRCTRDHFGSVMTMTLHRLLDSIRHRMICCWSDANETTSSRENMFIVLWAKLLGEHRAKVFCPLYPVRNFVSRAKHRQHFYRAKLVKRGIRPCSTVLYSTDAVNYISFSSLFPIDNVPLSVCQSTWKL